MWNSINAFLNLLALTFNVDRDSLVLIATEKNGGPTVSPGSDPGSQGNVVNRVEVRKESDMNDLPSLWYDSIVTNHVDFQIVSMQGKGKVQIPQFLYGWQHAPFFGNCRISMNRWVRTGGDSSKWTPALRLAGLRLRAEFASQLASTLTLVVSTGRSSAGYTAEVPEAFTKAHENSTHSLLFMDLKPFLASQKEA